ncbi:uncharacterized protein [Diadema antillarum]|uniref:uncharacterized protein n=1 Tax=Diadema antillarum TaxID=105358 RepID=UPI003A8850AE
MTVKCYDEMPSVQLVNGASPLEGLVFLESGSYACYEGFTAKAAELVCGELGFPAAEEYSPEPTPSLATRTRTQRVSCSSQDSYRFQRLRDCPTDECSSNMAVRVKCRGPGFLGCYQGDHKALSILLDYASESKSDEECISTCRKKPKNNGVAVIHRGFCVCFQSKSYADFIFDGSFSNNWTCPSQAQPISEERVHYSFNTSVGYCNYPSPVTNGQWITNNTKYGSNITLSCGGGYVINDSATLQCKEVPGWSTYFPQWNPPFASCRAVANESNDTGVYTVSTSSSTAETVVNTFRERLSTQEVSTFHEASTMLASSRRQSTQGLTTGEPTSSLSKRGSTQDLTTRESTSPLNSGGPGVTLIAYALGVFVGVVLIVLAVLSLLWRNRRRKRQRRTSRLPNQAKNYVEDGQLQTYPLSTATQNATTTNDVDLLDYSSINTDTMGQPIPSHSLNIFGDVIDHQEDPYHIYQDTEEVRNGPSRITGVDPTSSISVGSNMGSATTASMTAMNSSGYHGYQCLQETSLDQLASLYEDCDYQDVDLDSRNDSLTRDDFKPLGRACLLDDSYHNSLQEPRSCPEYTCSDKSEKRAPLATSLNDPFYSTSIYLSKPSENSEMAEHCYLVLEGNTGKITPDQSKTLQEPQSCPEDISVGINAQSIPLVTGLSDPLYSTSVYRRKPSVKSEFDDHCYLVLEENVGKITRKHFKTIQEPQSCPEYMYTGRNERHIPLETNPNDSLVSTSIYTAKSSKEPDIDEHGYLVLEEIVSKTTPDQSETIQEPPESLPEYMYIEINEHVPLATSLTDPSYSTSIYTVKSSEKPEVDENGYLVLEENAGKITPNQYETIEERKSLPEYMYVESNEEGVPLATSLRDLSYSTSMYSYKASEKPEVDEHGYLVLEENAGKIAPDQSETIEKPQCLPEYRYIKSNGEHIPFATSWTDLSFSTSIDTGKPSETPEMDEHGYLVLEVNAGKITPDQYETIEEQKSLPEYVHINSDEEDVPLATGLSDVSYSTSIYSDKASEKPEVDEHGYLVHEENAGEITPDQYETIEEQQSRPEYMYIETNEEGVPLATVLSDLSYSTSIYSDKANAKPEVDEHGYLFHEENAGKITPDQYETMEEPQSLPECMYIEINEEGVPLATGLSDLSYSTSIYSNKESKKPEVDEHGYLVLEENASKITPH